MKKIILFFFLGILPVSYSQDATVITSANQSSVTDNILIELKDLEPKNPSGEALPKTPTDNPIKEKPGTSDIKTNGNNNNTIVKPSQPIEIKVPTIINKPVPINTNKPNNTSPVTPIKNGKPGKG
jgi:hypothetical protein